MKSAVQPTKNNTETTITGDAHDYPANDLEEQTRTKGLFDVIKDVTAFYGTSIEQCIMRASAAACATKSRIVLWFDPKTNPVEVQSAYLRVRETPSQRNQKIDLHCNTHVSLLKKLLDINNRKPQLLVLGNGKPLNPMTYSSIGFKILIAIIDSKSYKEDGNNTKEENAPAPKKMMIPPIFPPHAPITTTPSSDSDNLHGDTLDDCLHAAIERANSAPDGQRMIVVRVSPGDATSQELRDTFARVNRQYSGMMILDESGEDYEFLKSVDPQLPIIVVVRRPACKLDAHAPDPWRVLTACPKTKALSVSPNDEPVNERISESMQTFRCLYPDEKEENNVDVMLTRINGKPVVPQHLPLLFPEIASMNGIHVPSKTPPSDSILGRLDALEKKQKAKLHNQKEDEAIHVPTNAQAETLEATYEMSANKPVFPMWKTPDRRGCVKLPYLYEDRYQLKEPSEKTLQQLQHLADKMDLAALGINLDAMPWKRVVVLAPRRYGKTTQAKRIRSSYPKILVLDDMAQEALEVLCEYVPKSKPILLVCSPNKGQDQAYFRDRLGFDYVINMVATEPDAMATFDYSLPTQTTAAEKHWAQLSRVSMEALAASEKTLLAVLRSATLKERHDAKATEEDAFIRKLSREGVVAILDKNASFGTRWLEHPRGWNEIDELRGIYNKRSQQEETPVMYIGRISFSTIYYSFV